MRIFKEKDYLKKKTMQCPFRQNNIHAYIIGNNNRAIVDFMRK